MRFIFFISYFICSFLLFSSSSASFHFLCMSSNSFLSCSSDCTFRDSSARRLSC